MKPTFALNFQDTSISLLHRSGAAWHQIGDVALDADDLGEALGYLRATALGLSPRGISTKLVIPNDQILYLPVSAPGPDASSRRRQIREALVGRTPYDVDDLVFDWWGNGPEVQVAVIARATLAEAEAFAVEHRFNPVSFVAIPAIDGFGGEPWFGPTSLAATLLAEGEKVDRDQDPISVTVRSFAAEPEVRRPDAPETLIPEDLAPESEAPEPLPSAPLTKESLPEPEPEPVQEIKAPHEATPAPQPEPAAPFATKPTVTEIIEPVADEAPMALDVPDDELEAEPAPDLPAPPKPAPAAASTGPATLMIADDLPPPLSGAAISAFSSRRSGAGTPPPLSTPRAETTLKSPVADAPKPAPDITEPTESEPAGSAKAAASAPTGPGPLPRPIIAAPTIATSVERPALASAKPGSAGKALRGLGALVTAPGIAGSKKPRPASPVADTRVNIKPDASNLAQSTKVPRPVGTGLGNRTAMQQRGKPKYLGLILTGLLLLFLALIAAWSSFSLASWQNATPAVETAANADIPAPEDEMLADLQDPAEFLPSPEAETPEPAAAPETTEAPLPEAVEAAPAPEIASETSLSASAAGELQDEIFLATADAPPSPPDPLALPQPDARGDPLPTAQLAPPPFGTIYQFDADGLIRPTPEGIITPEGVLLIAGRPPLVPPQRPAFTTVPAPLAEAATALLPTVPAPAEADNFISDPSLADARPKPRPPTLAPLASPADNGALLPPAIDTRLAGVKPRSRPEAVLAAGAAARKASAAASLIAQSEAAAVTNSASSQAPAISRLPVSRPRDLSRAVEAAVAAAVRQPDPEPEPAPEPEATEVASNTKAQTEAEADNEPDLAAAMPRLPTHASVAKQATFKNAINLSQINLIGVYGTKASRYALIRQTNGRYKKVKVGDKIDGGKVAAITSTEVRYQKGKKIHVLAMPNG